jgi:5,10-methylene-tetrahydrofolate dehydrogenase/methenyl tetrahydrofolate cyclohydrolase
LEKEIGFSIFTVKLKHMKIKSIFEQIAEQVFQMKDVNEMKEFTKTFVESKKIADDDKQRILKNISEIKNVTGFHRYICNSLLMYEGMGMNKVNPSGSSM